MGEQAVDTLVDQRLHGLPAAGSSTDVVACAVAEYSALPFVPGTQPQARCCACALLAPAGGSVASIRQSRLTWLWHPAVGQVACASFWTCSVLLSNAPPIYEKCDGRTGDARAAACLVSLLRPPPPVVSTWWLVTNHFASLRWKLGMSVISSSFEYVAGANLGKNLTLARFGHLVGYGGTYYAYLYATALAAALWRTHFAADPLSREAGASATHQHLAHRVCAAT